MKLTPIQRTTLKAWIVLDTGANALYQNGDLAGLADYLNADTSPAFIVFKTAVTNEAIGDAMDGTEVAGLASLKLQRLQVMQAYSNGSQNPSRSDRRAGFDDVFSGAGGQITRAALYALWRRTATKLEKVFATGTGSDASPATLVIEGVISYQELIGL